MEQSNSRKTAGRIIFLIVQLGWIPAVILMGMRLGPSPAAAQSNRMTPVVKAIQSVAPAVVNISTSRVVEQRLSPFASPNDPFSNDPFFQDFFDGFPRRSYTQQSLGSGLIISPDGYVLTNEHVILQAGEIKVTLMDQKEYDAELIGSDPKFDVAVLKIKGKGPFPTVKIGNSDDIMIGETIIAIGNPFGLQHTVTTGVVSARNRSIRVSNDRIYNDFIQLDASINPGNSGGPLINLDGEVIGINTAIYREGQGIGFAIPISRALRVKDILLSTGEIKSAWLGVHLQDLTERLGMSLGLDSPDGALVADVFEGGPAESGGLKRGDVITLVDGQKIRNRSDFIDRITGVLPGDSMKLNLIRDGKPKQLELVPKPMDTDMAPKVAERLFGLTVENNSAAQVQKFGLYTRDGVVITAVRPNSVAAQVGIREGHVILKVNNMDIKNTDAFNRAIQAVGDRGSAMFLIIHGRAATWVRLEP